MTSKPTKYPPGTLVHDSELGICIIGDDAKWDGTQITYTVICKKELWRDVPEAALRPLTFGEFLFYTDPATGGLKIGKNKAWPLLLANALALFGVIATTYYLITGDDPTVALALIPCIGVPVFTILGTRANWKNRQM